MRGRAGSGLGYSAFTKNSNAPQKQYKGCHDARWTRDVHPSAHNSSTTRMYRCCPAALNPGACFGDRKLALLCEPSKSARLARIPKKAAIPSLRPSFVHDLHSTEEPSLQSPDRSDAVHLKCSAGETAYHRGNKDTAHWFRSQSGSARWCIASSDPAVVIASLQAIMQSDLLRGASRSDNSRG